MKGYDRMILTTFICLIVGFNSYGQEVEVIKSEHLFSRIEHCENQVDLHIYNFWATWCAPCIRELPHFEKVNEQFGNVDVTLISIDDVDLLDKKVLPFIAKRAIKSKVWLLDETDFNEIINRIDKSWSGAIPATLIVDCKNQEKFFFEKEFIDNELEQAINKLVNQSK